MGAVVTMAAREREIHTSLSALTPAEQERVLAYIRDMRHSRHKGVPGHELLQFAGIWTKEEAEQIRRTIDKERGGADAEILERLATLSPAQQREMLGHARKASSETPRGTSGEEWLRGIPTISEEHARELREALQECRRIDLDGW